MNITQCAAALLASFPPEERGIPDAAAYPGRNASVMEALNAGLQECFAVASPWARWANRGDVLPAPATVTVNVTHGSRAISRTGNFVSSMATIVIAEDDVDNVLVEASGTTGTLRFPYQGTTGAKEATIYGDACTLDADVLSVHGPIRTDGVEISPRPNPNIPSRALDDYGAHEDFIPPPIRRQRTSRTASTPLSYSLETIATGSTAAPRAVLRFYPAPASLMRVEYQAKLKPPSITSIASTDALPIPFEFVQSVFLPIARNALMASTFFRDMQSAPAIAQQYQRAIAILADLNPNKESGIRLRPR